MPRSIRRKLQPGQMEKKWSDNLSSDWDLSAPFQLGAQVYLLAYDDADGKIQCWRVSDGGGWRINKVSTSDDTIPPAGLTSLIPYQGTDKLLGIRGDGSPVIIQLFDDQAQKKDIGATTYTFSSAPAGSMLAPLVYNNLPHLLSYDPGSGTFVLYECDLTPGASQLIPRVTNNWGAGWTAFTATDGGSYFIAYNATTGGFRAALLQGSGSGISMTTSDGSPSEPPLGFTSMAMVRANEGPTFLLYAKQSATPPRIYTFQFGSSLTLNQKPFEDAPVDLLVANSFVLQSGLLPTGGNEYYLFTQATRTATLGVSMLTLSAYRTPKPGYPG